MNDETEFSGEAILDAELEETVDGLPVLADVHPVQPASPAALPAALPAVHAAAAAATGFIAGAATFALVRRHTARKLARVQRKPPSRAIGALPVLGSQSFLVDVHLIAKSSE